MKRVLDISVGQRLAAALAVMLVVLAVLAAIVYGVQQESSNAENVLTTQTLPTSRAIDALDNRILYGGIAARSYLLTRDEAGRRKLAGAVEHIRSERSELEQQLRQADNGQAAALLEAPVADYVARLDALGSRQIADADADRAERELTPSREAALEAVRQVAAEQEVRSSDALEALARARSDVARTIAAISVAAFLSLAIFGLFLWRSIRQPARRLVHLAHALNAGDWDAALAHAGAQAPEARPPARDELRQIEHTFMSAARALRRREQHLRGSANVAAAVCTSVHGAQMAQATIDVIVEHAGIEVAALYVRDEQDGTLVPIASCAATALAPLHIGEGIPGQAALSRRAVLHSDWSDVREAMLQLGYETVPPRSIGAWPIIFDGDLEGVLLVASLRPIHADTIAFLADAAVQLAPGLHNARSFEHVQRLLAEVRAKNEHIQQQHEEMQSQNEEIQAQNEELLSQNEELQAQGEELQAQSEEIQAQSEQLQVQHRDIEERNRELLLQGDRLRAHGKALEETDRRKNEFLGLLAHELRNPLAALMSCIFVLRRIGTENEKTVHSIDIVERQTKLLVRLVEDLLDVTRITEGTIQIRPERLDLVQLVRGAVDDARLALEDRGLHCELAVPHAAVWMDGDPARLVQIVGNLLQNAMKFTEPGGRITVELAADAGAATLAFADDGIGIAEDLLPRLFTPFTQGKQGAAAGGLGLGLALVKALVALHHGSITATSAGPGRGSEFVMRLPIVSVQHPSLDSASASPAQVRRILVVDDNLDAARSLGEALELSGHTVSIATCGEDGVARAIAWRPQVVFCDIALPDIQGHEVARRLRADRAFDATLLVALTGYASTQDKQKAAAAGFDLHVAKPIEPAKMIAIAQRARDPDVQRLS